jgi:hypothetical protein
MPNPKYAAYKASRPYFELVRGALGDLVDGEHFFDIVTDDVEAERAGWHRHPKTSGYRHQAQSVSPDSSSRTLQVHAVFRSPDCRGV